MFTIVLFLISGLGLAVLMLSKRFEEKKKRTPFILSAISKGDTRVREWHHRAVLWYSTGKEKAVFFVKKQIPMYSKISLIKTVNILKERTERHIGNIRDSRLLKKSDGISEFFKNISDIEKGAGEINESYFEEGHVSIEPLIEAEEKLESILVPDPIPAVVEEVLAEIKKESRPRKPRVTSARKSAIPRKKKSASVITN